MCNPPRSVQSPSHQPLCVRIHGSATAAVLRNRASTSTYCERLVAAAADLRSPGPQGLRALQMSSTIGPLILMLKYMIGDFFIWASIAGVITTAFSVAIWEAFQFGADDYTQDECDIYQYFDHSVIAAFPRLATAYFGGGEDYVQCFARASDNHVASILMFVYLLMSVVILMNMLIAMMAKTFDKVHENYLRNYKARRLIYMLP